MNPYAAYLLAWLTYSGYPVVQRDAVYYAARVESGIRSDAVSPSGNVGLFQLNGSRKYALVAYARAHGKPWTSMQVQLEFMDREWRRMPASHEFFAAHDRATAARLFCRHYEGSIC
ncbi:MAG: phage tail tip lysozyme [Thiohalocapsa sp.]